MATVPGLTDKEFAELGYRFHGQAVETLEKEQLLFIIRHLIQRMDNDAEMMDRLVAVRQRAQARAYAPAPPPLGTVVNQREAGDWRKGDMEVETTKDDQAYHIKMTWRPWARWLRR